MLGAHGMDRRIERLYVGHWMLFWTLRDRLYVGHWMLFWTPRDPFVLPSLAPGLAILKPPKPAVLGVSKSLHVSYGQNMTGKSKKTWILYQHSSRAQNIIPSWNPMSTRNVALVSPILTAAHVALRVQVPNYKVSTQNHTYDC